MALQLKRAGLDRVKPLAGGFEGWRDLGLPIEPVGDITGADQLDAVPHAPPSLLAQKGESS